VFYRVKSFVNQRKKTKQTMKKHNEMKKQCMAQ